MFVRTITNGVLSERDRLLNYTVASFYNEMKIFLLECDIKEKQFNELKNKK
ncbi:MAG: hypothetical protein ACEQSR_16510 [Candidatus Methylacidiphilales bacterium]